jgi:hypothetical protein
MNAQSGQIPQYRADFPTALPTLPRKSWLRRNWLWLLGGLFVGGMVFVCGICMLIFSAMRGSDVAKAAMATAQSNPAVQQRLGAPVEEGFFVSGAINVTKSSGDADLAIPVSGPKGKGTVYVTAHKNAGLWNYSLMQATITGTGERIDLLARAAPTSENQSNATQTQPVNPPQPAQSAAVETPAPQPGAAADPPAPSASADPPPANAVQPPSGSSSDVIQSQDTNTSGIVAEIIQARRSEGVLTIKVRFRNTSNKAGHLTFTNWNASGNDNPKFYLTAGNKKYFMLTDTDGTVLSTNSNGNGVGADVDPGTTFLWWAKYPAPPADVKKVNFFMPLTAPFEDVPITDK